MNGLDLALERGSERKYVLSLFITGATERSARAVENVTKLCERHLAGRYSLQVIDVYQQPAVAKSEQVIAAPTLIKYLPLPIKRFIGDMSPTAKILHGMGLPQNPDESHEHENPPHPRSKPLR
jgi:circadian clock protein KaiB